ncbi:hypothetical protein DRQ53_13750 [bacterium]|nr:MAG: hypothetical protein DRQ32_04950 [bacterium]RKZ13160.1 MAG: hypothetical protein DRQ53_13750 [bacterium]
MNINAIAGVLVCLLLAMPAQAQTIRLQLDGGEGPTRSLTVVPGTSTETFYLSTIIDPGGEELTFAEWVQTPLIPNYPGVFRLGIQHFNGNCDVYFLSDYELGMHFEGVCSCWDEGTPITMLRWQYADFTGALGSDIVLSLRGIEATEPRPSSFGGFPGFVDCSEIAHVLEVSGGPAYITGAGAVVPSGSVVLNPTPDVVVGANSKSLAMLKSSFR